MSEVQMKDEEVLALMKKGKEEYASVRDSVVGFQRDLERDEKSLKEKEANIFQKYATSSPGDLRTKLEARRASNIQKTQTFCAGTASAKERVAAVVAALAAEDKK